MTWNLVFSPYVVHMKYVLPLIFLAAPVFADDATIEQVSYSGGRFSVTLSHADSGWDDYADGWRIELADGTVLGTRVLAHPHEDEQPFTRSSNINVPDNVTEVFVRASTTTGGWANNTQRYRLR